MELSNLYTEPTIDKMARLVAVWAQTLTANPKQSPSISHFTMFTAKAVESTCHRKWQIIVYKLKVLNLLCSVIQSIGL